MGQEKAVGFQWVTKGLLIDSSMQFDAIASRVVSAIYSRRLVRGPDRKSPVNMDDVPLHGFHGLDNQSLLGFVKDETQPEVCPGRSVSLILTQRENPGLLDEGRQSSLLFGGLLSTAATMR